MADRKLLIDRFGIIKPTLTEDRMGRTVARGEFGFADIPTENKRIYPKSIWEREIRKIEQSINEGKVMGELDHPSDGKTSLKRVSHVMTKLEMMEDGRIMGEATVCNNEQGRQLKSILDAGGSVGVSSRGMGSTSMNENGYEVVQEDYSYMTHDFVADPAVKTSYPTFSSEDKKVTEPIVSEVHSEKETAMETKVENKETKPKTEAKAEAPVIENKDTKVEMKPVVEETKKPEGETKQPVSETKAPETKPVTLSEEEVKTKLEVQKKELDEAHKKEVDALKSDPKILAGKIVLEDVAKLLAPVLLPEDVQLVVKDGEKKIDELLLVIESRDKEIIQLTEKCAKTAKVAHDLGMLLHFEQALQEGDNRTAIRKLVGDPKRFSRHQEIVEAVDAARSVVKSVVEDKTGIEAKEKSLREEFDKKLAEQAQELEKTKASLKEAAGLARTFGIRAYVLERVKNNPNAAKILRLTEKSNSKEEADQIIEKLSVDAEKPGEYNSIRARFRKHENSTLVEEHLKQTGLTKKPASNVVAEGVENEMVDLFPGANLDQVRTIGGL